MAKDKEKAQAKKLFMKGDRTQKEIASIVNVQEKTINNWVAQGGWKQQLEAKINGDADRIENLKTIIGSLTNKRLNLRTEIQKAEDDGDTEKVGQLLSQTGRIANEIAQYNKSLELLDTEKKVPLSTYIEIMDSIFKDLSEMDSNLYMKTIKFQEDHINKISLKY